MRRALELASLGLGSVSPNPVVGCVIVKDGRIIGEGWHRAYGEAHAEVNAVNSVANPEDLRDATAYVSLEPCAHFGKTPPCADLLVKHQLGQVVIAVEDPNPLVKGKGTARLREAGIGVVSGVLQQEAEWTNRRFLTFMREQRPYIILKWAQTMDGFIARENHDSKWISNQYSRKLVHKWRSEEDAILVGSNTVVYDDPMLTTRDWPGKSPVRIVLDPGGELAGRYHVLDGQSPTLVYTTSGNSAAPNLEHIKTDPESYLHQVMTDLGRRNLHSVIVEGGGKTLRSFIDLNLWDEARVFYAPVTFGKGIPAPACGGETIDREQIFEDILITYKR